MQSEQITVILPTYNGLSLLKRTIACLEKQEPDPSAFQTVVVDDGSSDGTPDYLLNYKGKLRLRPVLFPENKGRAAARNGGAKAADGRLLLFIDSDMEFGSDLVQCHTEQHKEESIVVLGRFFYSKLLPCRGYRRYIEKRGPNKLPACTPLPGRYFMSGHVSMPRYLFLEVGGFDENFRTHGGEDLDLGMRIVARGYTIIFAPELVTEHLHIRPLGQVLSMEREYGRESIPLLIGKHHELREQLKLDLPERAGLALPAWRIVLSEPVYMIIRMVGSILNGFGAPAKLYDYLIFRNYYMGYCEARK